MTAAVCRVCLASNIRMLCIRKSKLQYIYEKLSTSKLRPGDKRPEMICYICYSQLQRCRRFSDMSQKSNRILSNLLFKGVKVKHNTISKLNLETTYNLSATQIQFISLNHTISSNSNIDTSVKEELIETQQVDEDVNTKNRLEEELPLINDNNSININDTDVQFVCQVCRKKFTTESKLSNHLLTHLERPFTLDNNNTFKSTKLIQQPQIGILASKLFICDSCDRTFTDKHTLRKHITIHMSKVDNTCKNTLKTRNMSIPSRKKPCYGCDICNKVFTHSNSLKEHKRTHTGEKPYVCSICNKAFTRKLGLKTHIRIHAKEKPYGCGICNKTFCSKISLTYHKINFHNGIKPYNCKNCGREFALKRSLTIHMRVHTGEKPYKCKICDKAFTLKSSLNEHTKTHTGERPYNCNKCNKTFPTKKSLKTHMRTHTGEKPFACEICKKTFTQTGNLKKHQIIHTGEKPYECDICNGAFNQKSSVISHMRIHTGEKRKKPFICDICSKAFPVKSRLVNHKQNQHR